MLPSFSFSGPGRTRQINLGGSHTTATHADILDKVKAQRAERQDLRRKKESALKIQAWWRGRVQAQKVRAQLRRAFDDGAANWPLRGKDAIMWTRALIVGGEDWDRLGKWSEIYASYPDKTAIFEPFSGSGRESWLVLLRQISLLVLRALAVSPESKYAISHLSVLNTLLSTPAFSQALPTNGSNICAEITSYLIPRGFYSYISRAFCLIPVTSKTSPSLPPLTTLSVSPFFTYTPQSSQFATVLTQFYTYILSLPLVPNRLPIPSVTYLAANLQLQHLQLLDGNALILALDATSVEPKIHLMANLLTFVPVRIPTLASSALNAYLELLTAIMDGLPVGALEPQASPSSAAGIAPAWSDSESDSEEEEEPSTSGPSRFPRTAGGPAKAPVAPPPLPVLDARTQTRLQVLVGPAHLTALLAATARSTDARSRLISFFLSLWAVWPAKKDDVLGLITGGGAGGALVKEVWRGWVRGSPLGKEQNAEGKAVSDTLMDPSFASSWPPVIFLAELYTHALLTMGDDEFFSSANTALTLASAPGAAAMIKTRNPLTLDELTALSRQLIHLVFPLYWREDQVDVKQRSVPGVRMRWEGVRERITRCLKAIHLRDSRRPFTPPGHWLMVSEADMVSFAQAAVFEEQQLDQTAPSPRFLSKRQLAFLSPRLGVLNNIPFTIPFDVRVGIFRQFVKNDSGKLGIDEWSSFGTGRRGGRRSTHRAVVRRGNIAKDGFDHLGSLGQELKGRVHITFLDQWGNEESGIDGGGLFKEFLTSLSREVFDSNRGLWLATTRQELYPNPHTYAREPHQLEWYKFIGRVLGKALYEGILLDVAFASFFLAKWLGKPSHLDDLNSLDPELYQGLIFLKNYEGNFEELALNFTITDKEFDVAKTIELVHNGSNIAVSRDNRLQYIYLVSHYRLNVQIRQQSEAFFSGLSDIIDPKWLRMFNQQELQILIGGVEDPIDIDDLRSNAVYGGLYDDQHDTIQSFWKVVKSFDQNQRRMLLRFVTSCSRPPLLGFKELVPRFAIRDAGTDDQRLPTAGTCVNLLKLPRYSDEGVLRQKLLQAISSGAGFDLS
ncbi:hypothetical protein BOTBODRAFT_26989 [Botryobasidium botryosum FD-172 SS1]|uniref:HECT-type E3 ubiquitin transferase n=1 Tax=Botryobasidium botryosum (strain FD-172 SS1) TaxID=930990 RepID=A0A067MZ00_BOTB1|nr:hypothetical protein BOTBODRAFT_26989 [Botryobasidium botryosum FD-172 SS1]